jgi:hypothetical protein
MMLIFAPKRIPHHQAHKASHGDIGNIALILFHIIIYFVAVVSLQFVRLLALEYTKKPPDP